MNDLEFGNRNKRGDWTPNEALVYYFYTAHKQGSSYKHKPLSISSTFSMY